MNRRGFVAAMGAALAAPLARAQHPGKVYRLGLLEILPLPPLTDPFFETLRERGWVLGRNILLETRHTARDQLSAAALARELVDQGVDLLLTVTTANALAASRASRSIPIVMLASGYPVESGLAASLARPGGNVTGLSVYASREVFGKHVQLLRELAPSMRDLGVFWGYSPPAYPGVEMELAVGEMRRAAEALGIRLRVWITGTVEEFDKAMAAAAHSRIDALFVSGGGVQGQPDAVARIAEFTARRRLPTMSDVAGLWFRSGGLLAYSADLRELGMRAASYVDRILRGAKPGDLPIEMPSRFELIINLKAAKAIGVVIPQSLLARADRVIEW